jgi:hypothetical protein
MFTRQLYSKRLEAYHEIFELVSGFIKIINRENISYEKLLEFYQEYCKLDSKSSLLFSYTTTSSSDLIKKIGEILIFIEKYVFSENLKKELLVMLGNVETTLKVELGVYSYPDPTTITKKFEIPEKKKKALEKILEKKEI